MHIEKVYLEHFRNFKKATVNFNQKSLIIGPNDVGKTNLVHALRLLLDKSLSAIDLEPSDTDFNVESKSNEIKILIFFKDVTEDCVLSTFKGLISDNGKLVIAYYASRDSSGKKDYEIKAGKDKNSLQDQKNRHYLKALNLEYVRSSRDLMAYVRKEKRKIFEEYKSERNDNEKDADAKLIGEIQDGLDEINIKIKDLTFIKKSLSKINQELNQLTPDNDDVTLGFDSGALDPDDYVDNVGLVSESNGERVDVGGDGRNNQIFLSMWSSRKEKSDLEEVTIYCVEEPEAHLHPHNQRNLAYYLSNTLNGQVIITTHSPQIACEFSPNSIIKLYKNTKNSSRAASKGCSSIVSDSFEAFNYRLNILPAEAFFANSVLLVEGPSEVLFYKALSKAIGIDIDRLGISILAVNGVDFDPYMNIFTTLNIPTVVRTDNDISGVKVKDGDPPQYRLAGLSRAVKLAEDFYEITEEDPLPERNLVEERFNSSVIDEDNIERMNELAEELENYYIHLAHADLEEDIANSPISEELLKFYDCPEEELVSKMKSSKGVSMFQFLFDYCDSLKKLKGNDLAKPLLDCEEQACKNE